MSVFAWAPALTPFLMALKPCGVENFSPLLIGVLFDTVYLLSEWVLVSLTVSALKLQAMQGGIESMRRQELFVAANLRYLTLIQYQYAICFLNGL